MLYLKILSTLISLIGCVLWYSNPDSIEWEPLLVAVGLLAHFIVDIYENHQSKNETEEVTRKLVAAATGGDAFAYFMLYNFDIDKKLAKDFTITKKGDANLFNLTMRISDYQSEKYSEVIPETVLGEINSPAIFSKVQWQLKDQIHYGVHFNARNGSWNQELILRKSLDKQCWLAATRVVNRKGEIIFDHIDNAFIPIFGNPQWKNNIPQVNA
ncbi:hypothetical protein A6E05_19140 [Aliivibrio sp. 1S165]|nr:hypothetical protein [Aliivibrio sp. 1S165]OCH14563.1 hypothetical protein A6E05_19140 [Aliivibrio sp. 1S165]OCH31257.1 hypothetical protein A6E06_19135 [Aliivibrio sp. 1S175]